MKVVGGARPRHDEYRGPRSAALAGHAKRGKGLLVKLAGSRQSLGLLEALHRLAGLRTPAPVHLTVMVMALLLQPLLNAL